MSYAASIIDQLVLQGVTQFCIAPGSRSAPLAISAKVHPNAKTMVHFDERGMGFYALGFSKAAKKPVAIITTSGTAVANLAPACVEAYHSKTPLILLTADRPHELRQCGAHQTTEQLKLFSGITKWQMDLSPHLNEKQIRSCTAQAVFQSLEGTPGPVQLNCPFQEPLYEPISFSSGTKIHFAFPQKIAPPLKAHAKRGVIFLGSMNSDPKPVLELAERLKWPVFADLLSNARGSPTQQQIRHFHFLLQAKCPLQPDYILHFGDNFMSKHILSWNVGDIPIVHVSPFNDLQDPARRLTGRIQSDILPFCECFDCEPSDPSWLSEWQALDDVMHTFIATHFNSSFTEAHVMHCLPTHNPLFFGISMPSRLADQFFFPKKCAPLFANRSVSGIDGNIATIAGISDALASEVTAVLGDQTVLHDLNSLALLKNRPILLIIVNNFGGGIFDHLPSKQSPHLDSIFAASHAWNFEHAARMFDLPYLSTKQLTSSLPSHGIVELITDRKENAKFLEDLLKKGLDQIGAYCKKEVISITMSSH